MFGGVDLPRSAGRGFPPRIVVRGKLCAGMTGEVVGCSGEWTCPGVRAVGSRLRGNDGWVVGCSGEWTCPRVGAVDSRLRGNDERERVSRMAPWGTYGDESVFLPRLCPSTLVVG